MNVSIPVEELSYTQLVGRIKTYNTLMKNNPASHPKEDREKNYHRYRLILNALHREQLKIISKALQPIPGIGKIINVENIDQKIKVKTFKNKNLSLPDITFTPGKNSKETIDNIERHINAHSNIGPHT